MPTSNLLLNLSSGRMQLTLQVVVLVSQVRNDMLLESISGAFLGDVRLEAGHQVESLLHLQLGQLGRINFFKIYNHSFYFSFAVSGRFEIYHGCPGFKLYFPLALTTCTSDLHFSFLNSKIICSSTSPPCYSISSQELCCT
jgi:hypothetical protein